MKEIIYQVLNFLLGGKGIKIKISGFTLKLPIRFYKYFENNYELNNINFINNYVTKGLTVIDIGAHVGLLSIILFKKVGNSGKVFSFEPTPSTFKVLQKTISINNAQSVIIPINKAVADKSGETFFYTTNQTGDNSNSLADNKRTGRLEKKIRIEIMSIDELFVEKKLTTIDFIKIDAEGAEFAVLKGGDHVIDIFKPKILLGLHPNQIKNFGDSLEDIYDFLVAKKYKIIYKSEEISKKDFVSTTDLFDVFLM